MKIILERNSSRRLLFMQLLVRGVFDDKYFMQK